MNSVKTPGVIARVAVRMSPLSQAVLVYVNQFNHCTFDQLVANFCPDSDSGKGSAVEKFRARLAYLVSVGHLQRAIVDGVSVFQHGPGPVAAKAARLAPPVTAPALSTEGEPLPQRACAPSYDINAAPRYVPDRGPALRPGALDFKRIASHGHQC